MFSTAQPHRRAQILLSHVDKGHQQITQTLWKKNPELMLATVTRRSGLVTTPLKRAVRLWDANTVKTYQEYLYSARPDLLPEFYKQVASVDVDQPVDAVFYPLISAYVTLIKTLIKMEDETSATDALQPELMKQMKHLITQQHKLPKHMRRKLCQEVMTVEGIGQVNHVGAYLQDMSHHDVDSKSFLKSFGHTHVLIRTTKADDSTLPHLLTPDELMHSADLSSIIETLRRDDDYIFKMMNENAGYLQVLGYRARETCEAQSTFDMK